MSEYLDHEQKQRATLCVKGISDNLNAINTELSKNKSYKNYILEKLNKIEWDFTCFKNMCDVEE